MFQKNKFSGVFLPLLILGLGACTKKEDHISIENPYSNQTRQLNFPELAENGMNSNIYPYQSIGIHFVDSDTLAPNEYCILDGNDTLTYQEFTDFGNHSFVVVNSSGDTLQIEYFQIDNYVYGVFFPITVLPYSYINNHNNVWKPIRTKLSFPPFYSEYYEIRDYNLNTIFSSTSFDSTWKATNSHGPYYFYAKHVDWYGEVHEAKGEIVVLH
jgi:hypothetical protein